MTKIENRNRQRRLVACVNCGYQFFTITPVGATYCSNCGKNTERIVPDKKILTPSNKAEREKLKLEKRARNPYYQYLSTFKPSRLGLSKQENLVELASFSRNWKNVKHLYLPKIKEEQQSEVIVVKQYTRKPQLHPNKYHAYNDYMKKFSSDKPKASKAWYADYFDYRVAWKNIKLDYEREYYSKFGTPAYKQPKPPAIEEINEFSRELQERLDKIPLEEPQAFQVTTKQQEYKAPIESLATKFTSRSGDSHYFELEVDGQTHRFYCNNSNVKLTWR